MLFRSFNPAAAEGVMCRDTLSVGWDGSIYDCDFNQQLQLGLGEKLASLASTDEDLAGVGLPIEAPQNSSILKNPRTVYDINSASDLLNSRIVTDSHCFGCTAGAGSSCQGSTI